MTDGVAVGILSTGLVIWILGLVLLVLWIALPFAVFGIKKRLDAILIELKALNKSKGP